MWINYRYLLPRFPRVHQSALVMRGAEEEATAGFMRAPTLMEPFIVPGEERPAQGERGCKQWWVLALDIIQQWRSTLWWFRLPLQAFLFAGLLPPCLSCRLSPHSPQQSSAWVCFPDPTFQHPAFVCSSGHSQAGWAGLGSVPCVQVSLCPAAKTVAVFSSCRE